MSLCLPARLLIISRNRFFFNFTTDRRNMRLFTPREFNNTITICYKQSDHATSCKILILLLLLI